MADHPAPIDHPDVVRWGFDLHEELHRVEAAERDFGPAPLCPWCGRDVAARELCPACGDPEEMAA